MKEWYHWHEYENGRYDVVSDSLDFDWRKKDLDHTFYDKKDIDILREKIIEDLQDCLYPIDVRLGEKIINIVEKRFGVE